MKRVFSKLTSSFLAVLTLVSVMPTISLSSSAAVAGAKFENAQLDITGNKESTLAPGVTENQYTVYDKNGDQVKMFVATADMDVDSVKLFTTYKDMNVAQPGMQRLTEQVAAFDKLVAAGDSYYQGTAVVGINASYYNTNTGLPSGIFVMNGVVGNESETAGYFAVMKDGSTKIGVKGDYASDKGNIQEAIGIYQMLVIDGTLCDGLNDVEKYPRQTIGITVDGKVIIMTADGNQAPSSNGLTIKEQAQVMLDLGCVMAGHLDGGGSATYASKPAGSDQFQLTNKPSNGTERAVSNGFIIVSTAVSDGTFKSANLTVQNEYVTPGSTVQISAIGADSIGNPAEIPTDAQLQLADASMGSIENGTFVSNGTIGDAIVQMVYDGKVVGETTVHVVIPTALEFSSPSIIVPFGKSVELKMNATVNNGLIEVAYKTSDFDIVFEDGSIGSLNGLTFTANDGTTGTTSTVVTATFNGTNLSASTTISLGKGSEVVFDFEAGSAGASLDNWILRTHESNTNYNEQGEIYISNKENGLVHSGEQALGFHADFSQTNTSGSNTAGYIALSLSWGGDAISIKGAKSVGFWLYIPEDAMSTEITMNTIYYDANGTPQRRTVDCADDDGEFIYTPYWGTRMEGSGWHYVKADLSEFSDDLLIKDAPNLSGAYKRNYFIKIYCVSGAETKDFADSHGDFTYYIDDITVDYSDAVEDRELPVFSSANVYGDVNEATLTYGSVAEIADSNVSFTANVSDNAKANSTGLNPQTAAVYVDGNQITASYNNGQISSASVSLNDGYHKVKFVIADNNGNYKSIIRSFNVSGSGSAAAVEVVPHDPDLDRLYSGSVYWIDVVANDITSVEKVEALLNLNSVNQWILDQVVVAEGFEMSYSATGAQYAENDVNFVFTCNGEEIDVSSNVIASIPVRVWASELYLDPNHASETPDKTWMKGEILHKEVRVKVEQGLVTYTDTATDFFSDYIQVDTEAYAHYYLMDSTYHAEKGTYHVHTAEAIADLNATCTTAGYTDRTFCAVCNSVVDWGTTIPATGHTYDFVDNVLECTCGELFNGVYTDGKTYIDGVVVADGWVGDSYYKDGVKLVGIQLVDGFYYNFGEDGVCSNQVKYSGLFYDESVSAYRFAKLGELFGGWVEIDSYWYYFDPTTKVAVTGEYYYASRGVTYHFDETGKTEGVWHKNALGTRFWYGESYYKAANHYQRALAEIDGKTYNFDSNGYVTTGICALYDDWAYMMRGEMRVWEFDENGALIGQIVENGIIDNKCGGLYLIAEDGLVHCNKAVEYNGNIYFVDSDGFLKVDGYKVIDKNNGNDVLEPGSYYFGKDGKLFTGIKKDADGNTYYYKDGKIATGMYNGELVEIDGDIYLVFWSGKVAVSMSRYTNANGLLDAGVYYFGEDGKLFTGIKKDADGNTYYYKDGKIATGMYNGELVEIDGGIYMVFWSGKVAVSMSRYTNMSNANGLLDAGVYYFGEDGKLFTGIKMDADGNTYYYKNGKIVTGMYNSELVEIDGNVYMVHYSGKVAIDTTRYVSAGVANGLASAGTYYFGEDGKMYNFTGVKKASDGNLYYYKDGKIVTGMYNSELVEIDGNVYMVHYSGKVAVDTTRYVSASKTNGLASAETYYFDEDGKMYNFTGVKKDADGNTYYYENGKIATGVCNGELIEIDGSIYFVFWSGKVAVSTSNYVSAIKTNGLLDVGTYYFGEDGKLFTGVKKDADNIWRYYRNGKIGSGIYNSELVNIDGNIYMVHHSGKIAVSTSRYVNAEKANMLVKADTYYFDEEGKLQK